MRIGNAEKNMSVWLRILADVMGKTQSKRSVSSQPVLGLYGTFNGSIFSQSERSFLRSCNNLSHAEAPVCVALINSWLTCHAVGCVRGDHSCLSYFLNYILCCSAISSCLFISSLLLLEYVLIACLTCGLLQSSSDTWLHKIVTELQDLKPPVQYPQKILTSTSRNYAVNASWNKALL
jgi:hypothetical protein